MHLYLVTTRTSEGSHPVLGRRSAILGARSDYVQAYDHAAGLRAASELAQAWAAEAPLGVLVYHFVGVVEPFMPAVEWPGC